MASGVTGVLPELLSQSQILGLIQPQAVEQAKLGALGCHCCIPSLGCVVLLLRHVFSLSLFLSVKLNLLWGQVAKAKPHSGIAALCQLLPLSTSVVEPPRQTAKQSQGSLWTFLWPRDLQVSPCLSSCPIVRIWLLDADTDGNLLQALIFLQEGVEKLLMCLSLLKTGIQLLEIFQLCTWLWLL